MARLAIPSNWAGALVRQRGPLRTYQWLWLLLCAATVAFVVWALTARPWVEPPSQTTPPYTGW